MKHLTNHKLKMLARAGNVSSCENMFQKQLEHLFATPTPILTPTPQPKKNAPTTRSKKPAFVSRSKNLYPSQVLKSLHPSQLR